MSVALFLGEFGDHSRFSNHKKTNAFIGIDIRRYQSVKYKDKITSINGEIQKEGKSYI
nr:transposase [Virgibacillus proomii]